MGGLGRDFISGGFCDLNISCLASLVSLVQEEFYSSDGVGVGGGDGFCGLDVYYKVCRLVLVIMTLWTDMPR